eukprot:TRINITY_DN1421_c4_g1_i1.p1 TRINITY_DN1421_c4_g1~~TRINITY_DN1421_c4_g1_i1.p1  ORF type:complete len:597 (+),score=153.90 TRINITY_DN1421_c4_g1_i1:633-2423(+)
MIIALQNELNNRVCLFFSTSSSSSSSFSSSSTSTSTSSTSLFQRRDKIVDNDHKDSRIQTVSSLSSSSSSSTIKPGHIPLPHHEKFAKRWERVVHAMKTAVSDVKGLTALFLLIHQKKIPSGDDSTTNLYMFLSQSLSSSESSSFFSSTLPFLQSLVLRLPDLFPSAQLLSLQSGKEAMVELSSHQVVCLLAASFFCLHPENKTGRYNSANFDGLFYCLNNSSCASKLKCVLHYFDRMKQRSKCAPNLIQFCRRAIRQTNNEFIQVIENSTSLLSELELHESGSIEDEGMLTMQVDFANKFIGGGVLSSGCVQEEIRFVLSPECIVSLLICEQMEDEESVLIFGTERFSRYSGYGSSFVYAGDYEDSTPKDAHSRLLSPIIAIDALSFRSYQVKNQFRQTPMLREIIKAYAGFSFSVPERRALSLPSLSCSSSTTSSSSSSSLSLSSCSSSSSASVSVSNIFSTVSTGNWGCGAFNGDIPLKSILQWIAVSLCGKSMRYFSFQDASAKPLVSVVKQLRSHRVTISRLWKALLQYSSFVKEGKQFLFTSVQPSHASASLSSSTSLNSLSTSSSISLETERQALPIRNMYDFLLFAFS